MSTFVIASLVLAVGILGYVLWPLVQSRRVAGIGLMLLLGVSAGLLYAAVGTPTALDPAQRRAPESMAEAIVLLEAELGRDPNQIEGWRLLGGAYASQGRLADARNAYGRALQLAPDDPGVLAENAEIRALTAGDRRFDAEAVRMLERALAVEPAHQRARWFLGVAQRQAGEAAQAAATWEPLLAMVDAATAASLRPQINAARGEAGLEPLAAPEPAVSPVNITVSVSLDPKLAMQYPDGASVFVIARQADDAPVPVAARKLSPQAFPLTVTLTDADSLMPARKLSELAQVQLSARVSASGDASARPGDFESAPVLVDNGAEVAAALLIDRIRQ